ncbi:hypothetical protein RhiirA5_421779 [Rhizophagus irregularis]|uniref:SPRY domain-containing protein n=1 Tax=Rhizophagus irregularis TaxID=588596 RepID=A0A2I1EAX1_9GLOM|nr:hypothetical protein RhiirA5_426932 [Rhizophagus irregularis]PKC04790.1 hypothetical protein RhiirA5_421779 [Rhizophagus irregularis]PKC62061.1 hypothetical protein RhiirA1_465663 [Rhizophagus irregularis]PKY19254.1 hypothetical protein RhiirB3_432275 [Rhizophagus irregularis]
MKMIPSSSSLPVKYWFYYYEITILSNPSNDKTIIAVGFAPKKYSTNRLPGCNTHSVGFHSDEDRIFYNEGIQVQNMMRNGKYLGIAYIGLFYTWYPSIGSNCVCSLKVNFGQDEFKYKETGGMGITGIISHKADDIFMA